MNPLSEEVLADYLVGLGDDEMILAHRDSQWAGHAPILEEDIAFANIALDEMGHAAAWYRLAAEALDRPQDTYPDELVFSRNSADFRNIQMVELPNGDWAFSLLRQYLFDSMETVRLTVLAKSDWPPLAQTATKIRPEELYHARHTKAWVRRLGLGTEESNGRMQDALNELFPYALQLFAAGHGEEEHIVRGEELQRAWETEIRATLTDSNLDLPAVEAPAVRSRDEHTPHLAELVKDMQMVARLESGVEW